MFFFLESDIAQNLHVQIERAHFSPTENVFRRRLVVSELKSYFFKACKLEDKLPKMTKNDKSKKNM